MAAKKMSGVYVSWPKPSFITTVKTNKNFMQNFHGAMMYAHYELTSAELKRETLSYLKKLDTKHPLLNRAKDIDENRFTTIGKYMYILNHGADIPDNILPRLIPVLEKVIDEEEIKVAAALKEAAYFTSKAAATKNTNSSIKVVVSIQDRLREKAREVASEVEGWVDDFCVDKKIPVKTIEDFLNLFKLYELKAPHIYHLREIFDRRASELREALEGKDKDLIEAYSNYSKVELKKYYLFNTNLLKACDMLQEVAKIDRAPRKKKPVSQEKVVSKLKFKKDDNSLGIVSLNPVQILGAREVWTYNTRTRKLAQYKAADSQGILVKGTGLLNYTSDSVEKTIRKPIETLAELKKASKVKLRTFLKDLSTLDIPCNGKLNENHVILRIER